MLHVSYDVTISHVEPCHRLPFEDSKGGLIAQNFLYHGAIIFGKIGEDLNFFTYISSEPRKASSRCCAMLLLSKPFVRVHASFKSKLIDYGIVFLLEVLVQIC